MHEPLPTLEPRRPSEPLALLAYNAVADPEDQPDEAQTCGRAWLDDAAIARGLPHCARRPRKPIVVLCIGVVSIRPTPDAEQRAWASRLVGAGADLIVGSHPHVVQSAEILNVDGRRGFVAYSLGNFVFDQFDQKATSQSLVLRAWLDAGWSRGRRSRAGCYERWSSGALGTRYTPMVRRRLQP